MFTVLSPLYYCAPIHVYACYMQSAGITIEAFEHYQKGSYRNKCKIGTAQGPLLLSIPLKRGKHQQQDITTAKISHAQKWNIHHLRSIRTAYGKSPYFEHYIDELRGVIQNPGETLWELNWAIFELINGWIGLDTPIRKSTDYQKESNALVDFRQDKLTSQDLPSYPQVHEKEQGFQTDLSILDLIFHLGPESRSYLLKCPIKF